MTSERVLRQIVRLPNEAEQGYRLQPLARVRDRGLNILALDIENRDTQAYLKTAAFGSASPIASISRRFDLKNVVNLDTGAERN